MKSFSLADKSIEETNLDTGKILPNNGQYISTKDPGELMGIYSYKIGRKVFWFLFSSYRICFSKSHEEKNRE